MATPNDIYNEITRIDNAKQGIAEAIEEKGVPVPENSKIEEYPGLVRQIQQSSQDAVLFTPQELTSEQQAQARQNIGATAPEIFWAEFGVTSYDDVRAAWDAGKQILVLSNAIYRCNQLFFPTMANSYFVFVTLTGTPAIATFRLFKQNNRWDYGDGTRNLEITNNKSQSIETDRISITKYPSVKAVYDALGKYGVISQTQTWTGSASTGYTYTMSNLVWGLIPQANIDLYESAGAVFNETTGYFELNGLTDISYEEMKAIYTDSIGLVRAVSSRSMSMTNYASRTALPLVSTSSYAVNLSYLLYGASWIETLTIGKTRVTSANMAGMCQNASRLKAINGIIILNSTGALTHTFRGCASMESVEIQSLGGAVSFEHSPNLTAASVAYMINNSNTSAAAFTITLHATAYARCQADTTEYEYNGQTYVGIIAYAAARNISIVSA